MKIDELTQYLCVCFQGAYELAMTKYRNDYSQGHPSPMSIQQEVKLWEEHWLRGSKELNQWETLSEYANTKDGANPSIILESAWRLPNWNTMKGRVQQSSLCDLNSYLGPISCNLTGFATGVGTG